MEDEYTFAIGKIDIYKERDKRISHFITLALKNGAQLLRHRAAHAETIRGALHDISFLGDKNFSYLFSPSTKTVITLQNGIPLPDEKPSELNQETWDTFRKAYTTKTELSEKVGTPETTFFLGGVLERCVAKAMDFHHHYLRPTNQNIFYVPELCVVMDPALAQTIEQKLAPHNIKALSYSDACAYFTS